MTARHMDARHMDVRTTTAPHSRSQVTVRDRGALWAHGLLCARVLNTSLCVTHLNPHSGRSRLQEARASARRVLEAVRPL